jgi:hypothetical protein
MDDWASLYPSEYGFAPPSPMAQQARQRALLGMPQPPQTQAPPQEQGSGMPMPPMGMLSQMMGGGGAAAGGGTAAAGGEGAASAAPTAAGGGLGASSLIALPIAASAGGLWEAGDKDSGLRNFMDNSAAKYVPYTQMMKQAGRFVRSPQDVLKDVYLDAPKKGLGFLKGLFS